MKKNLKLVNRISIGIRLRYAAVSIASIIIVTTLAFFYFNLGISDDTKAAGEGTCKMTVNSGNTGNNQSFKPYSVNIEAEVVRIIPSTTNCTGGYNFNIEVAYDISFGGPGKANLNTLQGNIVCDNYNLWFQFPNNVMRNGGTGTFTTTVNPWRNVGDCSTVTPASLGCNNITITIAGEGIQSQSNVVCPNNSILPITLVAFNAKSEKETVIIDWVTGTEINNDYFTLERSKEGKAWEVIAEIDGAGNSQSGAKYQHTDKNPYSGMNYYRLKQTDFNGDFEYFKIVGVSNNSSEAARKSALQIVKAGPNPFRESFKITYTTKDSKKVELSIRNVDGQVVHTETLTPHLGDNEYTFEKTNTLKSGIYLVSFNGIEKSEVIKMVKL